MQFDHVSRSLVAWSVEQTSGTHCKKKPVRWQEHSSLKDLPFNEAFHSSQMCTGVRRREARALPENPNSHAATDATAG